MSLTDAEKERVRYHLVYPEVQAAASLQWGIPRPIQTAFLLESAMSNIIAAAEDRVRDILTTLDGLDTKLIEAQDYLVAKRLEDLELRDGHPDLLEREYKRWAGRLADLLGVPLYAYSARFRNPNAISNVRVV